MLAIKHFLSLILFLALLLLASGSTDETNDSNGSGDCNEISANADTIEVTFDTQDVFNGKQKTVVWTQNNSKNVFNGDLSVIAKEYDGSMLGSDVVFVEKLQPGQKTYAIIWHEPSNLPSYKQKWLSACFKAASPRANIQPENAPYKLLKQKQEQGGTLVPQIEFYLATDRNYDRMYKFLKSKQFNEGIFYHAVFVDNAKYAEFSKYPISAMYFEETQSKHIVATYWYANGNREFTYYEKNSWESRPKTRNE
ncbi:MAG: hypothetical protein HQM16_16485 [Deltaproteobacteria bacterium]|nr:hypothetical protein [Deltaproteobacteria bacterium]